MNIQNLVLDINKKPFQTITANVGEVASRFVKISIVDKSIPVDLTGVTVSIYAKKPDGKKVFNNVTIEDKTNGIILAELTSQILAVEGLVKLTLLLVKNGSKLCSKQFLLNVDSTIVDDTAIESTNEFTALTTALGKVNNIDSRFESINSSLDSKANENEVIKKGQVDLDEMTERTLQAIQGGEGANFNLLSIPRNSSVTEIKTNFFNMSTNRFNKDNITLGIIGSDGNITERSDYFYTEFLSVTTNQSISATNVTVSLKGFHMIALYDANKNFIKRIDISTNTYTVEENVYYVRYIGMVDKNNNWQLMINDGDVLLDYVEYYAYLKSNYFDGFNNIAFPYKDSDYVSYFDLGTNKITIKNGVIVYYGKNRFQATSETILDFVSGSSNFYVVFSSLTKTFRATAPYNLKSTDYILYSLQLIKNEWQVYGTIDNFDTSDKGRINNLTFPHKSSGIVANISASNKTITVYSGTSIYMGKKSVTLSNDYTVSFPSTVTHFYVVYSYRENIIKTQLTYNLKYDEYILFDLQYHDGKWNVNTLTQNYTTDTEETIFEKRNNIIIKPSTYFTNLEGIGHYLPKLDDSEYNVFHANSTITEYYNAWDELINNSNGYLTKTVLGKDSSGQYDIFKVSAVPQKMYYEGAIGKYKPKILLVCGVHGIEKASAYSLLHLFKDMVNNWKSSDVLEYLRWNVKFEFIPMVNPWGFQNLATKNANGVNINRNFPISWVAIEDTNDTYYGGAEPLDQIESQYIKKLIEDNKDAITFIDYHTTGYQLRPVEESIFTYLEFSKLPNGLYNDTLYKCASSFAEYCNRHYPVDYELNDLDTTKNYGYILQVETGRTHAYSSTLGVLGHCIECATNLPSETSTFTSKCQKANVRTIGEWLIEVVKAISKLNI